MSNLLLNEMKANEKIKVISPAMIYGSGLESVLKTYPKRLIDVGINEETAVIMASAMSKYGIIPVISIYSTFLQRAYDELNHDVSRTNSHVIFLVDRSGIVGADGDTHQGTFDISILTTLPNFIITMPSNLGEANALLKMAIEGSNPFIIRYPRGSTNNTIDNNSRVELGKWNIVRPITNVNTKKIIISYGPVINKFNEVLSNDYPNIGLVNAIFIKPIDINLLKQIKNKEIIIYEEVNLNGSLGSLIEEANTEYRLNLSIKRYGINDVFVPQGKVKELKKDLGLDINDILKDINQEIGE